jgi:CBS domain-containing protein
MLGRDASSRAFNARRNVAARFSNASSSQLSKLTVADIMTTSENIITCSPDTSLDDALELIVQNEITGLPVVDDQNRICGIISDFDLLALDGVSEEEKTELFPSAGDDWNSFYAVQSYVEKNKGTKVSDVMTVNAITVNKDTSVSAAAHLLLHKRIRRLPVLDTDGALCGIISRSNIIKAAWEARKLME